MKFCTNRRGNSTESEVFFNKMVGDQYRFLAEFTPTNKKRERDLIVKEGTKFYEVAMKLCDNGYGFKQPLHVCNRTRLSLYLHYANFKNEVLNTTADALRLADQAV